MTQHRSPETELASQKCIPCSGDMDPLTPEEASALLKQVPLWELVEDSTAIVRRFTFKNFAESYALVEQIAEVAEEQGHHPDILFGWGYCEVMLYTHAIGGLHQSDFIVAARIDAIEGV